MFFCFPLNFCFNVCLLFFNVREHSLSSSFATSHFSFTYSHAIPPPVSISQVLEAAQMSRFQTSDTDAMFAKEASKGFEENEEAFNTDVSVPAQPYWWHDKYRPRKPRFFNRVKTGYEWNKYNQVWGFCVVCMVWCSSVWECNVSVLWRW